MAPKVYFRVLGDSLMQDGSQSVRIGVSLVQIAAYDISIVNILVPGKNNVT